MPTNYPNALDDNTSLPTKSAGDTVASAETNTQSNAIKAIEAKLGIGATTPAQAKELGSTATGSSDWRTAKVFDVRDYGAVPDSGLDESGHINAAITAAQAAGAGAVVLLPRGQYNVASQIRVSKGIFLVGEGWGDENSSANPGANVATEIIYTGASNATGAVILFKSATVGNTIQGGGLLNLAVDAAALFGYAIRFSSCRNSRIENVLAQHATTINVYIDASNGDGTAGSGITTGVHIDNVTIRCGSTATGANGVKLSGQDGGASSHWIGHLEVEHQDGDAIQFGAIDSVYVGYLKTVLRAGGTGYGIRFRGDETIIGTGSFTARKNFIAHCGRAGTIRVDTGTSNRIGFCNSESLSVSQQTTEGGVLVIDMLDRIDGDIFEMAARYKMAEKRPIARFTVGTGATNTNSGAPSWFSIGFPDAVTAFATYVMPTPPDWSDGTIYGVQLYCDRDAGAGNERWTLDLRSEPLLGTGLNSVEQTVTTTVTGIPNAANELTIRDLQLGGGNLLSFTRGDTIFIKVTRIGGDAADTFAGTVRVLAATLEYRSLGPNEGSRPGPGTFDKSADYLA